MTDYTEADVERLVDVISEAQKRGIKHGSYTLARWILTAWQVEGSTPLDSPAPARPRGLDSLFGYVADRLDAAPAGEVVSGDVVEAIMDTIHAYPGPVAGRTGAHVERLIREYAAGQRAEGVAEGRAGEVVSVPPSADEPFEPMYGRVTEADRDLVARATSGGIRSADVQPQYEDEPAPVPPPGRCVFCERIEGGYVKWLDHDVASFEPLNPVTPGHLLVVPARHVADATESPEVSGLVMSGAARVAATLGDCNIITSVGEAATQTIRHLHLHVVPRHHGDGLTLPWTGQYADPPAPVPPPVDALLPEQWQRGHRLDECTVSADPKPKDEPGWTFPWCICGAQWVDGACEVLSAIKAAWATGVEEGRRQRAEKVEELQLLLDHAEQYARDLQDNGDVPGRAEILTEAYWKLREHASALRSTEVYRKASERKEGTLRETPAFQRYRWLEATARGIEDGARDLAEMLGVEQHEIERPEAPRG